MKRILYSSGEISAIEYDSTVPCLIDAIKEFFPGEELKARMNKGLELFIEKKRIHGQIGWLADTRLVPPLFEADLKWMAGNWTLRAYEAGLRHIAMIMPENYIAQMNIEVYQEYLHILAPKELSTGVFSDFESAQEWMKRSIKQTGYSF